MKEAAKTIFITVVAIVLAGIVLNYIQKKYCNKTKVSTQGEPKPTPIVEPTPTPAPRPAVSTPASNERTIYQG